MTNGWDVLKAFVSNPWTVIVTLFMIIFTTLLVTGVITKPDAMWLINKIFNFKWGDLF